MRSAEILKSKGSSHSSDARSYLYILSIEGDASLLDIIKKNECLQDGTPILFKKSGQLYIYGSSPEGVWRQLKLTTHNDTVDKVLFQSKGIVRRSWGQIPQALVTEIILKKGHVGTSMLKSGRNVINKKIKQKSPGSILNRQSSDIDMPIRNPETTLNSLENKQTKRRLPSRTREAGEEKLAETLCRDLEHTYFRLKSEMQHSKFKKVSKVSEKEKHIFDEMVLFLNRVQKIFDQSFEKHGSTWRALRPSQNKWWEKIIIIHNVESRFLRTFAQKHGLNSQIFAIPVYSTIFSFNKQDEKRAVSAHFLFAKKQIGSSSSPIFKGLSKYSIGVPLQDALKDSFKVTATIDSLSSLKFLNTYGISKDDIAITMKNLKDQTAFLFAQLHTDRDVLFKAINETPLTKDSKSIHKNLIHRYCITVQYLFEIAQLKYPKYLIENQKKILEQMSDIKEKTRSVGRILFAHKTKDLMNRSVLDAKKNQEVVKRFLTSHPLFSTVASHLLGIKKMESLTHKQMDCYFKLVALIAENTEYTPLKLKEYLKNTSLIIKTKNRLDWLYRTAFSCTITNHLELQVHGEYLTFISKTGAYKKTSHFISETQSIRQANMLQSMIAQPKKSYSPEEKSLLEDSLKYWKTVQAKHQQSCEAFISKNGQEKYDAMQAEKRKLIQLHTLHFKIEQIEHALSEIITQREELRKPFSNDLESLLLLKVNVDSQITSSTSIKSVEKHLDQIIEGVNQFKQLMNMPPQKSSLFTQKFSKLGRLLTSVKRKFDQLYDAWNYQVRQKQMKAGQHS